MYANMKNYRIISSQVAKCPNIWK